MAECHGCGNVIADKYILRVSPDLEWHHSCLRCSVCDVILSQFPSCFMNNGKPYCKEDYENLFQPTCQSCSEVIEKSSLVMKVNDSIYHVDCFVCTSCGERLLPGDQFSVTADFQLLCTSETCSKDRNGCFDDCWSDANSNETRSSLAASHLDVEHSPASQDTEPQNPKIKTDNLTKTDSPSTDCKTKLSSKKYSKDKPTRVRTVLNEKQLSTLKRCYAANPRPDSVMKEQLVDLTGLSPRVIRVWFQNKRCKDKKKSMLMNSSEGTARDIMQGQLSLRSPPLSDEMSLPGCSPPLSSVIKMSMPAISSCGNSRLVDQAVQNLHLMVNEGHYRNTASFPSYDRWAIIHHGEYQNNYQDSSNKSGHYHQLVS